MSTNTNQPSKQDLSSSQDNKDETVTPNLQQQQQQQQQAANITIIPEKKSDPSAENDDNTPLDNITQEQQQQQQPQKEEKADEEEKKDSISKPMIDDNDNDDDYDDTKDDEKESKTKPVVGVQRRIFTEQKSSTKPVFDPQTHEPILSRDIPNKIIVARGKKLSFYYERARRILRLFDGMIITGFGPTVYIACSLVEVLKRNQMAVITHTETKFTSPMEFVNLDNDNYNNPGKKQYYQTSPPQAGIIFHLKVGKYGKYLSGYHQRKMMELFEKYDNLSGFVSVEDVKSMNLYKIFHANNDQIVSAEKFLSDSGNLRGPNNSFILPDFIKYCSLIVHPLIRDNMFKKILYTNFRIGNYYNLLNRNISDEDMGINDNIDMNDDNMNDDNINDDNVIDDNANDNNVNDEKMNDDGNMNDNDEEDEEEDEEEDDNNINLSIAKPNDDNKIDGNGNGNGNGNGDDDEEQEEEDSVKDEKEIDDERNIFDMDEVASPISPISPPGHTNHPSNKSNIQISSAHSNSMQQQVLQQQEQASQQQQESTQQKEQEEEPVPQQPTNQINNTDKQND